MPGPVTTRPLLPSKRGPSRVAAAPAVLIMPKCAFLLFFVQKEQKRLSGVKRRVFALTGKPTLLRQKAQKVLPAQSQQVHSARFVTFRR